MGTEARVQWPFVLSVPVRFRDLDAMGHVNNAVYLSYLEQARNELHAILAGVEDPSDLEAALGFVVARMEIDYLAPVHFPDTLEVAVRPDGVGRSSFTLTYEGRRRDGVVALRARSVQVAYDWAGRSSMPVPDRVRDALEGGAA